MNRLFLDICDCDDGRHWCAVIFIGERQVWSSPKYPTKRDAKQHGEEVLREFKDDDQ